MNGFASARRWLLTLPIGMTLVLAPRAAPTAPEFSPSDIYRRVSPSVVAVIGINQERNKCGQGAGSIVTASGHVLTNAHVVIDGDTGKAYPFVTVFFRPDKVTGDVDHDMALGVPASVAHIDAKSDLAVLHVARPARAFRPIPFGDSGTMEVGDPVAAIGHPSGGGFWTLTTGAVSGRHRQGDLPFLQTEVAMNPGNSGGPLLDRNGLLVGVNTFVRRENAAGFRLEGMSYSLEADYVNRWLRRLDIAVTVRQSPTTPVDGPSAPPPETARVVPPQAPATGAKEEAPKPAPAAPPAVPPAAPPAAPDETPPPREAAVRPPPAPAPTPSAVAPRPEEARTPVPDPGTEADRPFVDRQGQRMYGVPNSRADLQQLAMDLLESMREGEATEGDDDQERMNRALERARRRLKERQSP